MNYHLMYLRKSRADRDFADEPVMDTLKRHKSRLDDFCRSQGIVVEQVFYEIVSADSIAARPEMLKLLAAVETGRYAGVVVVDLERLCRGDSIDQGIVVNTFKYSQTSIITPYKTYDFQNEFDEESAEYGLMMGRNEYRRIKRRLWNGRIDSIKEGKYVGGNAPYGYRTVKLKKQKGFSLEIVPEEADVVRLIFDMYINGAYDHEVKKDVGAFMIARLLNERGYSNQFGRPWHQGHISKILKDDTYTGKIVFMRRVEKKEVRNGTLVTTSLSNNPGKLVVPGLHEAIISNDIFQSAQEKRISRPAPHVRSRNSMCNPFCGVIRCGLCGQTLHLRSADNTGRRALYCHNVNCGCAGAYIDFVESRFLSSLHEWTDGYEIESNESEDCTLSKSTLLASINSTQREISDTQKQLSRTYDLLEQGIYSVAIFQERSSCLNDKLRALDQKLVDAENELERIRQYEIAKKEFIPKIQSIIDKYHTLDTIEAKNRLIREVIDRIDYVKTTRGRTHGDEFTLRIFPRIPRL